MSAAPYSDVWRIAGILATHVLTDNVTAALTESPTEHSLDVGGVAHTALTHTQRHHHNEHS